MDTTNTPFKGYATSTDYELLWRLVQDGYMVPCWRYVWQSHGGYYDWQIEMVTPDYCFSNQKSFLKYCTDSNLHFIPPTI